MREAPFVELTVELTVLAVGNARTYSVGVKLLLENLPPSLANQRETLAKCLEAMNSVLPLKAVYLFGSHARGEARPDSDVDLCIVAEGAERQLKTAGQFREAISDIWPKPAFTLIPITPTRLDEKKAIGDFFFRHSFEGRSAACRGKLTPTTPPTGCGLRMTTWSWCG